MELTIASAVETIDSDDLEAIKTLSTEIIRLHLRRQIYGGLSGARIWIADIEFISNNKFNGPCIIKIQNADAAKKEQAGNDNAARSSQFAKLMPILITKPIKVNKSHCILIFSIAKGTFAGSATIDTLLKQDVFPVISQLELLMQILKPDTQLNSPGRGHPCVALKGILGTLVNGKSSISSRALSKLGVGKEGARLTFIGDTDILPNPIAYLENEILWGEDAEIFWPVGPTHGDFNCQNIICSILSDEALTPPDLIDFSNFRLDGYLLYDLSYLEFDLLLRILPLSDSFAQKDLYRLSHDLTNDIILPTKLSGGAFVLQVQQLITPLRRHIHNHWIEKANRPDDYYIAYWLGGVASGLNYMRKANDLIATKLSFNYAARCLANVLRRLSIDWTTHREDYQIRPINEITTDFSSADNQNLYKLSNLEKKQAEQEKLLNNLYLLREEQKLSSKTIAPELQNKINDIEKNVILLKNETDDHHKIIAPSVYFSIHRNIILQENQDVLQAEQRFTIETQLTNLGFDQGNLDYVDGFSDEVIVLNPDKCKWSGNVQPGQTIIFSYDCYCSKPGVFQIYTKELVCAENIMNTHDLPRTNIKVVPCIIPPQLTVHRYYWPTQTGVQVFVRLYNQGEKIAKNIKFQESFPNLLPLDILPKDFKGDIFSGTTNQQTVTYTLAEKDPNLIHYSLTVEIPYEDNLGQQYLAYLYPTIIRLEYPFPEPKIIGRDAEINEIQNSLSNLWDVSNKKKKELNTSTFIIEGHEGQGKTRLLNAIKYGAQKSEKKYKCIFLDSEEIRSHIRELIIKIIEINDFEEPKNIEKKLKEYFPLEEEQNRIASIMAFLGWGNTPLTSDLVDRIKIDIVILLSKISLETPLIIIFDNLHLPPQEGIELEIFRHVDLVLI